jgi:hypothetical protein
MTDSKSISRPAGAGNGLSESLRRAALMRMIPGADFASKPVGKRMNELLKLAIEARDGGNNKHAELSILVDHIISNHDISLMPEILEMKCNNTAVGVQLAERAPHSLASRLMDMESTLIAAKDNENTMAHVLAMKYPDEAAEKFVNMHNVLAATRKSDGLSVARILVVKGWPSVVERFSKKEDILEISDARGFVAFTVVKSREAAENVAKMPRILCLSDRDGISVMARIDKLHPGLVTPEIRMETENAWLLKILREDR